MFTRRRASAVSERAQRAKRTERSGSLPRIEIPGEFPSCKHCFCFLVLAWTLLTLFASLYALPVHLPRQVYVGWFWSPRRAKDAPRGAQDAPREAQDTPRGSQEAPKTPQEAPKTPQEALRTPPGALKTPQEAPKTPPRRPKTAQDPSKTLPRPL